jgi:hypothetical protein
MVYIVSGVEAGELLEFFEPEDEGVAVDEEGFGGEGEVEVVVEEVADGVTHVIFGVDAGGEFFLQVFDGVAGGKAAGLRSR